MSRGRFPGAYGAAQVLARALAWITAVMTIVILGFIVNRWPDKGGAIAAGLVGSAIALLNDSWLVAANIDRELGFPRMSPSRALLHDLFALAICLGGIVMIIFSHYTYDVDGFALTSVACIDLSIDNDDGGGDSGDFSESKMLAIALWTLASIVIWRLVFIAWGCFDCYTEFRRLHPRRYDTAQSRA